MNNKIKKSKGFTLTELIVVIVIIGILAAVLIPTLTGYIKKANQSADEQEVAMLNKMTMLWDYEDNKPASVKELKEMLEEEGYTGDYSLRVKGNYLWYDVKENRFTILAEEKLGTLDSGDLTNLATNPETYKLTTNMKSPEGLLNNNGSEVWLVGGNGELVEIVETIRNISQLSNPTQVLNEVVKKINDKLKNNVIALVESSVFSGEEREYLFTYENGEFKDVTYIDEEVRENIINADKVDFITDDEIKLMEKFHSNIILGKYTGNEELSDENATNIDYINYLLKQKVALYSENKQNNDGSYDYKAYIIDDQTTPYQVLEAFNEVMKIIKDAGAKKASIIPLINNHKVALTEYRTWVSDLGITKSGKDGQEINYVEMIPCDLATATNYDFASLLILTLNYNEDATKADMESYITKCITGTLTELLNKNSFTIECLIEEESVSYTVKYNFTFEMLPDEPQYE